MFNPVEKEDQFKQLTQEKEKGLLMLRKHENWNRYWPQYMEEYLWYKKKK
jgi:hypothetical protein